MTAPKTPSPAYKAPHKAPATPPAPPPRPNLAPPLSGDVSRIADALMAQFGKL